jgi:hypothetical protein
MQIFDNIGSLPFISWAISIKLSDYYLFMPVYTWAKLRWKISQNKIYNFWQVPIGVNLTFVKHMFYYWMYRIET